MSGLKWLAPTRALVDESGTVSGGVDAQFSVTASVDASGYENVSRLDLHSFWAVFSGSGPGRFWVCVCRLWSGFFFGWGPTLEEKPAVIRRSLFDRLKSGSFGGHPWGQLLKLTQTEQGVGTKEGVRACQSALLLGPEHSSR